MRPALLICLCSLSVVLWMRFYPVLGMPQDIEIDPMAFDEEGNEIDMGDFGEDDEEGPVDESNVVILDAKNFTSFMKKTPRALVEWYSPWCGHCKAFKPTFAKLADAVIGENMDVKIVKIDASSVSNLATKYGIEGYPTLQYFLDGRKIQNYNGDRELSDLVDWVKAREGPAVMIVGNVEEGLKKARETPAPNEPAVHFAIVATIPKSDKFWGIFDVAAFGSDRAERYFKIEGAEGSEKELVMHKLSVDPKYEKDIISYTEKQWNTGRVQAWVKEARRGLVGHPATFKEDVYTLDSSVNSTYFYVQSSNLKEYTELAYKIANKFPYTKYSFITEESDFPNKETFGLTSPPEVVANLRKYNYTRGLWGAKPRSLVHKFTLSGPLTEERVTEFMTEIGEGTRAPHSKSESPPSEEEQKKSPVKIVVGETFEDIVLDEKKDVLLEYYAPWCGHCKQFAPIYDEIATLIHKKYQGMVVVAKIDATANDADDPKMSGFPSIVFYPAGKRSKKIGERLKYEGPRTLEGVVEFIEDNTEVGEFEVVEKKKKKAPAGKKKPAAKDEDL